MFIRDFDGLEYKDQDKASGKFRFKFGGDSDLGIIDKKNSIILPLSASAKLGVFNFKNMVVKAIPDTIVVLELEIQNVSDQTEKEN